MSAGAVGEKGVEQMAVVSVTTLTVKPDGYEEALVEIRKVKAFTEKCGGKNVRLVAALVAGQATGTLSFITEADDFGANAALTDSFLSDPEGQAIFARANSSARPFGSAGQTTLWVDVPL